MHGGERVTRGVAIVAQSSNMAINLTMQQRGLPIAHVATVGNAARIRLSDLIEAYAADERVSAIGVHLEGLIEGAGRFAEAVRAAHRAGKPVVAFKTGWSEAGARATLSHTSSMAGADDAFGAFLTRLGVPRADGVPGFLETLKLLHVLGGLPGERLLSMSCSGGEAALVADTAARLGVPLPALDDGAAKALAEVLGPPVAIDNPLDYHTYIWLDRARCEGCYRAGLAADVDVGMLVLDYPKPGVGDETGWDIATDAYIAAAQATGRPALLVASLPECLPDAARRRLMDAGVAPMQGIEEALKAVKAAAVAGAALARAEEAENPAPSCGARTPEGAVTLDEWRAKRRLAAAGLTVPEGALVTDATEAVAAAEALGYPVAVKAVDAGLAHKSELGAVRLALADGDAVAAAVEAMAPLAGRFLVERMVDDPVAELIVGITRDSVVGLCLMVGAGGVLAEVLEDRALLALPCGRDEIARAIGGLRVHRLLAGHRGRPAGDLEAVLDAVEAVARFAEAEAEHLLELDINPLIVRGAGSGAVAADALIRLAAEEREREGETR